MDVFAHQRDPDYFPDPMKFDPDRWEDETKHSPLLLFGMGQRACFGKRLATAEVKMFLFTMMQRYEVESVSDKPVEAEFVFGLQPKGGDIQVILKTLVE